MKRQSPHFVPRQYRSVHDAVAMAVLGLFLFAHPLHGEDRSRYRDFQLGSDLPSVAARANMAASDATTIHQRPAVMQELEWRPPYFVSGSTAPQTDPVRQIVFSFYNDQLFRMVIDYDRHRTEGLTDRDMVEAMSEAYGPALQGRPKKSPAALSPIETESGATVARWGDTDYSVVLYRSSYASEFRVIVASSRLDALARTAAAQAARLDDREAPQRELARKKLETEEARASQEKARVENKATFRP